MCDSCVCTPSVTPEATEKKYACVIQLNANKCAPMRKIIPEAVEKFFCE